jgi:hypothetical protein
MSRKIIGADGTIYSTEKASIVKSSSKKAHSKPITGILLAATTFAFCYATNPPPSSGGDYAPQQTTILDRI